MKNYGRFIRLILPHGTVFILGILSMLLLSVFEASPLGLIIPVVDKIIAGKEIAFSQGTHVPLFLRKLADIINNVPPKELLSSLIILLVALFSIKELFDFLQTYFMSDISQRVIRDIKNMLYKKLLGLSMDFYSHQPTGQLMSRITHDSAVVRDAISTGVADTFSAPIKIFVYVFALVNVKIFFGIPWKLVAVAFVVFPLILFPVLKIGKRLRKISRESQEKIADINNMLLETITGIKLVKSFGMEDYEERRFTAQNQLYYKLNMKSIMRMKSTSPITEIASIVCAAVILWMAGSSIINGEMSAGAFISFLAMVFLMMKPVKKLTGAYGINQQALAAADRIFQILDFPPTIKDSPCARELKSFERGITFEAVRFAYDKDKGDVLKGINLSVKKGEIVALVGPSGGGKTTLVNLISRFYDPGSGSVKIDGVDIREVTVASLREKIGLVTQETILFNDTLKTNICYGHEDADDGDLIRAAKAANAHDFISEMPEGYRTVIGERGARLSGGERQRLAIARAIYKNPPILILDEATSQLDSESERLVQEALGNLMKGRTVIAIAHRLSTVVHADKIVVMDEGRIVDMGTHAELLDKSPLYKRLYEIQFAGKN